MSHRLYVGNLSPKITWRYLKDLFREHNINIVHANVIEDFESQRSKGFAIVEVASAADVRNGMYKLSRTLADGRSLNVREDREEQGKGKDFKSRDGGSPHGNGHKARPSNRSPERHSSEYGPPDALRIFVKNLPAYTDWALLKDICKDQRIAGLKHVDVLPIRDDRTAKGSASIEFATSEDARDAMAALDGLKVDGYTIRACEYRPVRKGGKGKGAGKGGCNAFGSRGDHEITPPRHREEPPKQGQKRLPPLREEISDRRLFCENLAVTVDWRLLKDLFAGDFDIEYTNVLDAGDEESFGVVEFKSRADALEACMSCNGMVLEGRQIRLRQDRGEFEDIQQQQLKRSRIEEPLSSSPRQSGKGKPDGRGESGKGKNNFAGGGPEDPSKGLRVFIGHLPYDITRDELMRHMERAGKVNQCGIPKDENTGQMKGYGIAVYSRAHEVATALSTLNESTLNGRTIYVQKFQEKGKAKGETKGGSKGSKNGDFKGGKEKRQRRRDDRRSDDLNGGDTLEMRIWVQTEGTELEYGWKDLIVGEDASNMRHIRKKTGASVWLLGRGANMGGDKQSDEDLHIKVSMPPGGSKQDFEKAIMMCEDLLDSVYEDFYEGFDADGAASPGAGLDDDRRRR